MQRMVLTPGVNRQASQTLWSGGYWDASLVRWRQGMPEKFGGWVQWIGQQVLGVPRSMLGWNFLTGDAALAIGTNARLHIAKGGTLYDVTPVQQSASIVDGISTSSGSAEVVVDLTGSGLAAPSIGDFVFFPAVSVGGIALGDGADGFGCYEITDVLAGPVIKFQAQAAASSTVAGGGGSVLVSLLYPVGPVGFVGGLGYGAGAYSRLGYGDPADSIAGSGGMRYWSMGAWGQNLLAVPDKGPLFQFVPSAGGTVSSRAERVVSPVDGTLLLIDVTAAGSGYSSAPTVSITGGGGSGATATANIAAGLVASVTITDPGTGYTSAPSVSFSGGGGTGAAATAYLQPIRSPSLVNGTIVVAGEERRVIALGSGDLGADTNFDPMLIRWCSRDDNSDWYPEPDATNSAGFRRVSEGSRLVAGLNLTLATLVWSDTSLIQMRFVGSPNWYGIDVLGRNCGLVGPGAFAEMGGVVYWMAQGAFWQWSGGAPSKLDCSLYEDVFGVLNENQLSRVACGANIGADEILWFYAGESAEECDRAVILNVAERVWYPARFSRTVWIDRGAIGRPMAATAAGVLYQQETGVDADGGAMGEFFETGYVDVSDGGALMLLQRLIPDWQRLSGAVQVYVKATDYPGRAPRVRGPFTLQAGSEFLGARIRGRQVALRLEGVGAGGDWRMGALRADAKPLGSR